MGRAKLPILGPNPYSVDFMDGDARNTKLRLEFTMKRLTDVIMIVSKCVSSIGRRAYACVHVLASERAACIGVVACG